MIKEGKGDELWNDTPNKKRHKDIDARWTKKNNETFYGYKKHAKVDTKSKFIDKYKVTDASVHDSQALKLFEKFVNGCCDFFQTKIIKNEFLEPTYNYDTDKI